MTLTTLFTGGGLADTGYHAAGFQSVQGIELDVKICEVARANGIAVTEGNILDFNFKKWQRTDALHASPPCTNASVANSKGGETALDIALAEKVAEAITYFKPSIFTMEEVTNYRNFKSFQIILNALSKEGYFFDAQHVNFADLGVPQSRVRLIVRAIKGFLPAYPTKVPHKGWYEAIKDLIPTLPESSFATWQLKRLEEIDWIDTALFPSANAKARTFSDRKSDEPSQTQTIGENRAFLLEPGLKSLPGAVNKPAHCVTVSTNQIYNSKAFIVDGGTSSHGKKITVRTSDEPFITCNATSHTRQIKAWLEQGRVVKMTPRANARFQTLPDSYILPEQKSLAQKIIGNGVPCLGMQKIAEGLRDFC